MPADTTRSSTLISHFVPDHYRPTDLGSAARRRRRIERDWMWRGGNERHYGGECRVCRSVRARLRAFPSTARRLARSVLCRHRRSLLLIASPTAAAAAAAAAGTAAAVRCSADAAACLR